MKSLFSIVAFVSAFLGFTATASDDHYPGFYVGMEPPKASVIDPTVGDIVTTDDTPTIAEVMASINAVADGFAPCVPIPINDFLKVKFSKPSWVNQSCYDSYISAMADVMAHYYDEVYNCKKANGDWDCDCLAAKKTKWLGKLGEVTLWMLLNCSYGQPQI